MNSFSVTFEGFFDQELSQKVNPNLNHLLNRGPPFPNLAPKNLLDNFYVYCITPLIALPEDDEAGAEDGAGVPQPERLVQAHQLADVVLGGRP